MKALRIFTIYRNPLDFPSSYVVRGFTISDGEAVPDRLPFAVVKSLEAARAVLPPALSMIPRSPDDHASVVESWL